MDKEFFRPVISLCLATSLDGKISEFADAGPRFTSRFDRDKLFRLRAASDVLLIGANTVRHEELPPLIRAEGYRQERIRKGLAAHPDVCIVSATLNLPWHSAYFTQACQKITVITGCATPAARLACETVGVTLIETGTDVDLTKGLDLLCTQYSYQNILCEGGGTLVSTLLAQDLVDCIYLTIAPTFIGGFNTPTLTKGQTFKPRPEFKLVHYEAHQSELHLVYEKPAPKSKDTEE